MPFPKRPDQHKNPINMVPTCYGIYYVMLSVVYLFITHLLGITGSLVLVSALLFGSFFGLVDDIVSVRWRTKALFPVVASLPLIVFRTGNPVMNLPFLGNLDFGVLFYLLIIPLVVTVVTNSVNMLGGLNGISSICPGIVMSGLFIASILNGIEMAQLLVVPLIVVWALAYFSFRGKVFIGNVGSFSIGIAIVSFAVMVNLERTLFISIIPFISVPLQQFAR